MKCAFCAEDKATFLCGQCKVMPYCGVDCSSADWEYHGKHEHCTWHSDAMSMILSGKGNLWVGGLEALQLLDEKEIGAVITILQKDRVDEQSIVDLVGTRPHLRFYMYDAEDEPIETLFAASTKFISRHLRAGRNVLVHCHAGISRSVTLCIHYMVSKRGFQTPALALKHIRRVRSWANPNEGFMRALNNSF